MKNSDPEARAHTERICGFLGLAPHLVSGVVCPGPGDLEIHRARDNRIYVLDFARLFPPEHSGKPQRGHEIFYELFRPEFVRRWNVKLCSDALSGWGRHDPEWKTHNRHVREASEHLRGPLMVECAQALLTYYPMRSSDRSSIEASALASQYSLTPIREQMRQRGIGMRHMSVLRQTSADPLVRMVVLTEMARRAIFADMSAKIREMMQGSFQFGFEAPFQQFLIDYVSMLYGAVHGKSQSFWSSGLLGLIEAKYGTQEFRPTDCGFAETKNDLSLCISVPLLLSAMGQQMGFRFAAESPKLLLVYPPAGVLCAPYPPLVARDVNARVLFAPRVKFSNFSQWFQGRALLAEAVEYEKLCDFMTTSHLLEAAREPLESAHLSAPLNAHMLIDLLFCLVKAQTMSYMVLAGDINAHASSQETRTRLQLLARRTSFDQIPADRRWCFAALISAAACMSMTR